jgi:low affinity Fe/Cu permease
VKQGGLPEASVVQQRRIWHRTKRLPILSRILYKIEHYGALPAVAVVISGGVVACVVLVAVLGFPTRWVAAFEVSASAVTIVMVFAILHTQGREQAATQRKLDELIHALPGADESLMMLEEASREDMLRVEDEQRTLKLLLPGSGTD